ANEKFASAFSPGMHGTTFGGGPLICATALEVLTVIEQEKLLANIRARSAELRTGLERLASRFDFIREIRGEGLLLGMEWSSAQVRELFHLAAEVKAHPDRHRSALAGRSFALIFEKPSLRTRVTFEVGIASLGGTSIFLDHTASHLGDREPIADVAKCLERWVHGIVARVFAQESLDQLAASTRIPVINALSDRFHPCQALADFFTLEE